MNEKVVRNLKDNYKQLEQSIVAQLHMANNNHHLTTGHYREAIWESLFRQIIPHKFSIKQGVFLIDSKGKVSYEIDLAVFDEQYTPYIFNYGKIHYIPIEAVAIVVQCKSENVNDTNNSLSGWVDSIDELKTNSNSIARIVSDVLIDEPAKSQPATRPIKILCSLKECLEKNKPKYKFDIAISASKDGKLKIAYSNTLSDLYNAYKELNCREKNDHEVGAILNNNKVINLKAKKTDSFAVEGNSILSLIFQLNQLLMLINNPMLFPHQAYVKLFNDIKE